LSSGDPDADFNSEEHALYAKGLRAGSLGTLVLSSAYVIFSLFHSKVLAVLGKMVLATMTMMTTATTTTTTTMMMMMMMIAKSIRWKGYTSVQTIN
jgi:hypothetical protein